MLTLLLPPKTAWSLSSARISRLFSGFWRLLALMYSHTLLTTSVRGSGEEPTTAASSFDGCSGFIRAGLTFLPNELLPALASLPDVPSAGLALLPEVLFTAGALAFLAGPSFAASTFLSGVLCFVLP